jgi:hypothetical protein
VASAMLLTSRLIAPCTPSCRTIACGFPLLSLRAAEYGWAEQSILYRVGHAYVAGAPLLQTYLYGVGSDAMLLGNAAVSDRQDLPVERVVHIGRAEGDETQGVVIAALRQQVRLAVPALALIPQGIRSCRQQRVDWRGSDLLNAAP